MAALSTAALACSGGGAEPDAGVADAAPEPPGEVTLSWQLVDGDETLACDDVGAVTVSVTLLPLDAFAGEVRTGSCDVGQDAFTFEVAPGPYTARVELIATTGAIGDVIELSRFEVESGATITLDPVTFEVSQVGGASFRAQAQPFNDNCEDDGTPPIEEMRFEIETLDGTCVPTTFQIGEGESGSEDEYDSACDGATTGCVEHDQLVQFEDLEPGDYRLEVLARDETDRCFGLGRRFKTVGGGRIEPLGEILLREQDDCEGLEPGEGEGDDEDDES